MRKEKTDRNTLFPVVMGGEANLAVDERRLRRWLCGYSDICEGMMIAFISNGFHSCSDTTWPFLS